MSIDALLKDAFTSISTDKPILETLLAMQADNQARSGLDDRTYLLVRLAALVALDASPASYLVNFALADQIGVSAEEVRGMLIALAPVVGSARTIAAADHALRGISAAP